MNKQDCEECDYKTPSMSCLRKHKLSEHIFADYLSHVILQVHKRGECKVLIPTSRSTETLPSKEGETILVS